MADAFYGESSAVIPGIDRVLARNPKDYTGTGTNTYVVGEERLWIIDPGPDNDAHIEAVLSIVGERMVEGIFVTHSHLDHSPAARPLSEKTGAKVFGFGALSPDLLALTDEEVDATFDPDIVLADRRIVGDGEWRIMAVHTPGHFPNHMAYFLPEKGVLFSGDHVMGWSTTVVVPPLGNMSEYLTSLDRLEWLEAKLMLPSHGQAVTDPEGRICEVRAHRLMRQKQVEACVSRGILDPAAIVDEIYEGLAPGLQNAARHCVIAHLEMISEMIELTGYQKQMQGLAIHSPDAPSQ